MMGDIMSADPDFESPGPKASPRRSRLVIKLLLVTAILAILVALLLPASRSSREAAATGPVHKQSEADRGWRYTITRPSTGRCLPRRAMDASGRALHSWRTLILPFLQQESLYRSIDLAKPWNDTANATAFTAMPPVFRCPSGDGLPNTTNYLAIVGPSACFLFPTVRALEEITNDHATTLMLIEAGLESAVPWMAPLDADSESLVVGFSSTTKLDHPGGTNAVCVDGDGCFINWRAKPASERRAMIAVSGSERKTHRPEDSPQRPGELN